MTDVVLESIRALVVLAIVVFLFIAGRRRMDLSRRGWRFILAGFGLLLFACVLDLTDNFPALDRFVVVGDTATEAFFEKLVGYLGGFVLLAIGLLLWIPTVAGVERIEALTEQLALANTELQIGQERLRAIVTSVADGIITVDRRGRVESVNPAAERLFGFDPGEMAGLATSDLTPEADWTERGNAIGAAAESYAPDRSGGRREVEGRRRDGERFPLELLVSEMRLDDRLLYVGIVRDVTARRRTEDELKRATQSAEDASAAKSRFLTHMSHELRTPLNAIIGYSFLLSEEAHERKLTTFVDDLGRIRASGQHLLHLINGILDLAKIEAGRMALDLETFDVGDLVRDVAAIVRPIVEKSENTLELACADGVGAMRSDTSKVRQILLNLLSNACKFTVNGTITLSVDRVRVESPEWVEFRLVDTGIGMSPDQLDVIFEEFEQADTSSTRRHDGTGLGLTITRRFCDLLGGSISVHSEPGRGSDFTVRLPARTPAPDALGAPGTPRAGDQGNAGEIPVT